MSKTILLIFLGILTVVSIGVVTGSNEWYENDELEGDGNGDYAYRWGTPRPDVAPVEHVGYNAECGGCHFAYQPGLLSAGAWNQIMDNLGNHYSDDASLDPKTVMELKEYLLAHAARTTNGYRSERFGTSSTKFNELPRITATRFFRHEHNEIPRRFIKANPAIGSFSNCSACHPNAIVGIYDEDRVVIPGIGRWDD